jgi:hypothetical protein
MVKPRKLIPYRPQELASKHLKISFLVTGIDLQQVHIPASLTILTPS